MNFSSLDNVVAESSATIVSGQLPGKDARSSFNIGNNKVSWLSWWSENKKLKLGSASSRLVFEKKLVNTNIAVVGISDLKNSVSLGVLHKSLVSDFHDLLVHFVHPGDLWQWFTKDWNGDLNWSSLNNVENLLWAFRKIDRWLFSWFLDANRGDKVSRIREATVVESSNSEVVVASSVETDNLSLAVLSLAHYGVFSSLSALFLGFNDVALDSRATRLLWSLPFERDRIIGDLDNLDVHWWSWHFSSKNSFFRFSSFTVAELVDSNNSELIESSLFKTSNSGVKSLALGNSSLPGSSASFSLFNDVVSDLGASIKLWRFPADNAGVSVDILDHKGSDWTRSILDLDVDVVLSSSSRILRNDSVSTRIVSISSFDFEVSFSIVAVDVSSSGQVFTGWFLLPHHEWSRSALGKNLEDDWSTSADEHVLLDRSINFELGRFDDISASDWRAELSKLVGNTNSVDSVNSDLVFLVCLKTSDIVGVSDNVFGNVSSVPFELDFLFIFIRKSVIAFSDDGLLFLWHLSNFNDVTKDWASAIVKWSVPSAHERSLGHIDDSWVRWSSWRESWVQNLGELRLIREVRKTSRVFSGNSELVLRSLGETSDSVVKFSNLNSLVYSNPFLSTLFSSFNSVVEDIRSTIFFGSSPLNSDGVLGCGENSRLARHTRNGESVLGNNWRRFQWW